MMDAKTILKSMRNIFIGTYVGTMMLSVCMSIYATVSFGGYGEACKVAEETENEIGSITEYISWYKEMWRYGIREL